MAGNSPAHRITKPGLFCRKIMTALSANPDRDRAVSVRFGHDRIISTHHLHIATPDFGSGRHLDFSVKGIDRKNVNAFE